MKRQLEQDDGDGNAVSDSDDAETMQRLEVENVAKMDKLARGAACHRFGVQAGHLGVQAGDSGVNAGNSYGSDRPIGIDTEVPACDAPMAVANRLQFLALLSTSLRPQRVPQSLQSGCSQSSNQVLGTNCEDKRAPLGHRPPRRIL